MKSSKITEPLNLTQKHGLIKKLPQPWYGRNFWASVVVIEESIKGIDGSSSLKDDPPQHACKMFISPISHSGSLAKRVQGGATLDAFDNDDGPRTIQGYGGPSAGSASWRLLRGA